MKINTIIIDDESLARDLIKSFLQKHDEITLLGEYSNGFEGLKAINETKPDLVILDVQMPKITGFEMLELLDHHPIIIFSTAYNQFAIKAFELNAVDYLLKPYSAERFGEAISKAVERFKAKEQSEDTINNLIEHVDEQEEQLERVVVKIRSKIHVISVDNLNYLESQDDYVMLYTDDGKYLKQKTMRYFENHLDPKQFVRIHRSYIVKVSEISRLELFEKESYIVILHDGTKLKVSRTGYPKLKKVLDF
ncbi:LytTR family transcriptional regulator DNA-binding domain-containing protein [Fulvivirgaceae bacterium BMA10]|uniref:LytTR family transcriptional regulator DNA-binding domain-containing protein n=1 Tax=Splendidivirga corallicola TaxID=3051826 RepID=A0ABT8KQM9_9BACT|nr:LytTR family transcriptional regulator DNA-binding domain-containing protein [Fulvivirgaceae bacterium BMA10]